jgi:hypothetical protein
LIGEGIYEYIVSSFIFYAFIIPDDKEKNKSQKILQNNACKMPYRFICRQALDNRIRRCKIIHRMRKIFIFGVRVIMMSLAVYCLCSNLAQRAKADTSDVNLSTTVQTYMTFSITAGSTVTFGNLTPGTPICFATGTVASVTTNAANGYTLGVSDGVASSNSALVQSGTYITDYAGTIATPTLWTGTGLGTGLYAADTNKGAKWGSGATVCDSNNKYAGVPEAATTAHTVTGYHSGADTSSWSFKVDAPNTQKTGAYSGAVTFTATAVLS